ncbi:response regulator transcription factor [Nocardioides kongjuensis]|uniref:DNA-binding response OmpR family regulator n=1 Tax=Nocardioides kongjuensis TaxID=349522 RepID=A0A852RFP9_9ACTN|nr:DNA-binding response OmpR family regulator [Nocardioides kongjuensis]
MESPLVLLVEDDDDLRTTTRLVLESRGFRVVTAADGEAGWTTYLTQPVDLAVVDVVLPQLDGLRLTERIRADGDLPVLLLTARDLPRDQVVGFDAGADDYVVKPFDGDVLEARLRSLLRRRGGSAPARVVERDGLRVDVDGMTVERDGVPVELSATEFRLLTAFLDNAGIVLGRTRLLELVWGSATWGDPHVVDVTVQRLRAKIGAEQVVTVRGAGYKMARA